MNWEEQIKKLSELSMIEVDKEETKVLAKDIQEIVEYFSEVNRYASLSSQGNKKEIEKEKKDVFFNDGEDSTKSGVTSKEGFFLQDRIHWDQENKKILESKEQAQPETLKITDHSQHSQEDYCKISFFSE